MVQSGFGMPLGENFMRQPDPDDRKLNSDGPEEMHQWHRQLHSNFEMGTVYTMIAGLLNVLVIFDAAAGPFGGGSKPQKKKKKHPKEKRSTKTKDPPVAA